MKVLILPNQTEEQVRKLAESKWVPMIATPDLIAKGTVINVDNLQGDTSADTDKVYFYPYLT